MPEIDRDDYLWNPRSTPDPEVVRIETALRTFQYPAASQNARFDARLLAVVGTDSAKRATRSGRGWRLGRWPIAAVAAALLMVIALAGSRRLTRPWAVVTMSDTPGWLGTVQTRQPITAGDWIVTDAKTRARLNVGALGRAEIGPSSRVRLVRAAVTEHRLALAEGTLHARIWAPPRFFLVETPAALAVDLGCVYTIEVDSSGAGFLRVQSGEVELVGRQVRARVPAGNTVHVNQQTGPGLPFPNHASPPFIAALTAIEQNAADTSVIGRALPALLREPTARTTITLWHLLPRVDSAHRVMVIDRLAQLAPLPSGIERTALMRLDPEALDQWRTSMEQHWSTERTPPWKRWWRSLWRTQRTERLSD